MTLVTNVTYGQALETINGDKIYTGDIRFNKGLYYGINNSTLPSAFDKGYTKVAIIYDQPTNTNLPLNIGSAATAIHDQGITNLSSYNTAAGEPRYMLYKSRGTIFAPTNVIGGDLSGSILFRNYYNGAYRNGANISSFVQSPSQSNFFPSSNLKFSVRKQGNIAGDLDQVLELDEVGQVKILQLPQTSNIANRPNLLTRNATSGAVELLPQTAFSITSNGFVGINTASPQEALSVNGNIRAKQVKVETVGWPDYVFAKEYNLLPIENLGQYIQTYQHLPEIPTAAQMEKEGINLGEINKLLVKKIEELTLYMLQQQQEIKKLSLKVDNLTPKH